MKIAKNTGVIPTTQTARTVCIGGHVDYHPMKWRWQPTYS